MSGFWKVCSFICTQYLVEPPFAWITASMRRGMEAISLWHCSGVIETQVALIAAFRSSALLSLVSLIFLLSIPHRFSGVQVSRVCWPMKHSNTMVIEPAFGTFGSVRRWQVLLGNEINFFTIFDFFRCTCIYIYIYIWSIICNYVLFVISFMIV